MALVGLLAATNWALRLSESVFDIGVPGIGPLARWRRARYPQAPVYPLTLKPGADFDARADLVRMSSTQIPTRQVSGCSPAAGNRVTWFLEGRLHHHGGTLIMASDALEKSSTPTIRRLAERSSSPASGDHPVVKRLQHDGLNKPEHHRYDGLSALN